jgi:hypothetical protein
MAIVPSLATAISATTRLLLPLIKEGTVAPGTRVCASMCVMSL